MSKVVFLDRDGVVNKYPGDSNYVLSPENLEILPGVREAIQKLCKHGFLVFVVSNQACVSKGLVSAETLISMTENLLSELDGHHAFIEGVYYCIHTEEQNCRFRKPNTGIFEQIFQERKFCLADMQPVPFFIGDSIRDVKAAKAFGLRSILVFSGREKPQRYTQWETVPDYTFDDLQSAVEFVVSEQ